jgi:hypothetical protein
MGKERIGEFIGAVSLQTGFNGRVSECWPIRYLATCSVHAKEPVRSILVRSRTVLPDIRVLLGLGGPLPEDEGPASDPPSIKINPVDRYRGDVAMDVPHAGDASPSPARSPIDDLQSRHTFEICIVADEIQSGHRLHRPQIRPLVNFGTADIEMVVPGGQ